MNIYEYIKIKIITEMFKAIEKKIKNGIFEILSCLTLEDFYLKSTRSKKILTFDEK